MRQLEQYVRGSQLPEAKPKRPALLRPSSIPARTASGGLGVSRGEAQTPFENYVPAGGDGGGGSGEVTPLPVGDVTLLDHSSGNPIDISQASSVVLRMNSRLHIFPFTVSARNPGGSRVWKCDVFIEPGGVQPDIEILSRSHTFSDVGFPPEESREFILPPEGALGFIPIASFNVVANVPFGSGELNLQATEGVHFELTPIDQQQLQGLYVGMDISGFPQTYFAKIRLLPKYFEDFGSQTDLFVGYGELKVSDSSGSAYSQISSTHGRFIGSGGLSSPPTTGGKIFPTQDANGNEPIGFSESQTAELDISGRVGDTISPIGRRSWTAKLVYFERTDEWLCTSGGLNPFDQ